MGNSQSSSSNGPNGGGRSSRTASAAASPRARQASLPDDPTLSIKGSTSTSSPSTRRRKKSIELSDVDPSLGFTKASGSHGGKGKSVGPGSRRKLAERVGGEILIEDELDGDEGAQEPEGTLRGAMQGKAEHVVYGPRRDNGTLPAIDPANLPASPRTAAGDSKARPQAISLPPPTITPSAPMDPDDTVHPGFKASPRLTSEVLLSQHRMPVLSSPMHDSSNGNPFEAAQTAALSQTQSNVPPVLANRSGTMTPTTSLSAAASAIFAPDPASSATASTLSLPPPTTSPPFPTSPLPPSETVMAPVVPTEHLPLSEADIPSGTPVIGSPVHTPGGTNTAATMAGSGLTAQGFVPSPAVLLPPRLFNAPVAAIPIPLISVPSATIAANLLAAAVDLGAGADGIPTLIKWKDEDGQQAASGEKPAKGPKEVFVTGTFAKGWKTKIELNKTDPSDFSALISLPPGSHRLKFIVDSEWKASKHLPVATDADGNLINYLQVNPANAKLAAGLWNASSTGGSNLSSAQATPAGTPVTGSLPAPAQGGAGASVPAAATSSAAKREAAGYQGGTSASHKQPGMQFGPMSLWPGLDDDDTGTGAAADGPYDEDDDSQWTQEIPPELVEWGEWEAERDAIESTIPEGQPLPPDLYIPPPPASSGGVAPPSLPAQLEKGPLNHAAYVTQGSGDDNSILPKPDHSVINHLAASPIKGGFLSVGVTTRYKRKFVTVVYYKALSSRS